MKDLTKIVFYPAITLNGFIAKTDGDSAWVTEEDEQLFAEEVKKAGCVIVGSRTFNQFKDIIYPIAGATTFVCTSRYAEQPEPASAGIFYVGGDIDSIVKQVHAAGFSTAVLSGGGDTNGRFAEAGGIDEVYVSIYPFLFDSGLPMFGKRQVQLNLELFETRQLQSGVIHNRYKVVAEK